MTGAPSTRARTRPSEVEAQKFVERPTTAFKHTEPLGEGVILTRTPSCSKYLSCSATQIAPKAKFGTAVIRVTSGISFCCARAVAGMKARISAKTMIDLRLRFLIRPPVNLESLRVRWWIAIGARGARSAPRLDQSR